MLWHRALCNVSRRNLWIAAKLPGSRLCLFPDGRRSWILPPAAIVRGIANLHVKRGMSNWLGVCQRDLLRQLVDLHPALFRRRSCRDAVAPNAQRDVNRAND